MVKKLRKLRIQVQVTGKPGKPKPPATIVWDGQHAPLPLVQQRCKGVKSLRKKSGDEYELKELAALPDNFIVIGSITPSKLSMAPSPPPPPEQKNLVVECSVCFGNLELPDGLTISKHAKDRMCRRGISAGDVANCCEKGKRVTADRMTHEGLVVVQAKQDGTVATLYGGNIRDTIPCDPVSAKFFLQTGLIQTIREQLHIGIQYFDTEQVFELTCSNPTAIERAKYRLDRAAPTANCIVRVTSAKDTCGLIIGKKGQTINRIRNKLGMIHKKLQVRWDEEAREIVITSQVPYSEECRGRLFLVVDDIIRGSESRKVNRHAPKNRHAPTYFSL
jgi:predicted RNA-binding protein YlqC (UPF0109 family)